MPMCMLYGKCIRSEGVLRGALPDQLRLLIRLRWLAVVGIVSAGVVSTRIFSALENAMPIYACAAILLLTNVVYMLVLTSRWCRCDTCAMIMGMCQFEIDLVLLTALLHFSGGITNPFVLFYVFHVIIAAIILPGVLSFVVGMSAIVLFGLMAIGELNAWWWLVHVPLLPSVVGERGAGWNNPVYILGEFAAFVATVVIAQYLTRSVMRRMSAKEIEAARNHDVLRAMITAMSEGLLFITVDGRIPICNPAARAWAGGGRTPSECPAVEDFPQVLARHIGELLREAPAGGIRSVQFDLADRRGSYIEARSCPVIGIDGGRLGYVIVGQDLTEHKQLEHDLTERTEETAEINEMLKRSRVEMANREKMVAVGQMASGIAHEIGNPLASLSSVAQYLRRKLTGQEEKDQLLMIEHQVDRISTILKRMLSLSRPATSEYRWTDVNAAIDNTLALIRFDMRARCVQIRSTPNPDLPMVWLNPLHFEQVLLNVTINALDAMAATKGSHEHVLAIERRFREDMIEVAISDSGIGMSPDVCRRAFESFFTTKEIGKGTGLGLFISYNLISEVDGEIRLDSRPGDGTTVTIRVPIRPKKHLIGSDTEREKAADDDARTVRTD